MLSAFFDASIKKNIGATICIGQEIRCLPYVGFCFILFNFFKLNYFMVVQINHFKKKKKIGMLKGMAWAMPVGISTAPDFVILLIDM